MTGTSRTRMFVLALSVSLGMFCVSQLVATPQSARGLEKGKGHNKRRGQSTYYDQGYRDGQNDAANRRSHRFRSRLDNDADRRAYEAGYDAGYRQGVDSRGRDNRDRDRDYRDRDRSGRSIGSSGALGSIAAQNGSQDGLNDGRRDRATGHSFRPTEGDNYRRAERGYYSQLGNRDIYKQEYRQAYVRAYQQGYGR